MDQHDLPKGWSPYPSRKASWGVWLYASDGRYFAHTVIKKYKVKKAAYVYCEKLNATLNDGAGPGPGEGYVVRSLS